jgi:uncharacterized protein (TIGR02147 family)
MGVFQYKDYKAYFRDLIRSKGNRGEYRRLAEYLSVHPTLISQILSGDKDFSPEQILKVAKYYGLGKSETRYLVILVEIERAGSVELKNHFIEMRNELQKQSLQLSKRLSPDRALTDHERAIFYSSWIYSAAHLMSTLDPHPDFETICRRLKADPERARQVISFLKSIGLVYEEKGKLKASALSTHIEKGSPFLFKHHANWRIKALEKTESLTDEELMYSVNVSLSKRDFHKFREEMVRFIQEFLKGVKDSPPEELAQLNLDFFWV